MLIPDLILINSMLLCAFYSNCIFIWTQANIACKCSEILECCSGRNPKPLDNESHFLSTNITASDSCNYGLICLTDNCFDLWFIECADGNVELAQQRMEEMLCLDVAALAAMTHLPVQSIAGTQVWRHIECTLILHNLWRAGFVVTYKNNCAVFQYSLKDN